MPPKLRDMIMRVYFNLTDGHASIPDAEGIEVVDLQEAWLEAERAIEEIVDEDPAEAHQWTGWSIQVVDAAGEILFSRCLIGNVH
jgi:hypothetical protein